MNKVLTSVRPALLPLLASLTLSACGGGSADTAPAATTQPAATAESAVAAGPGSVSSSSSSTSSSVASSAASSSAASSSAAAPASASSSSATSAGTQTPAAVSAVVTIDFANAANYANPSLPGYYAVAANDDNTPASNAVSDRAATLGRVLFYDRKLSINDGISCASCHQQAHGFDDPARFSQGFSGAAFTTAHAMRLGNVRYYAPGSMFWNKRAASVEAQATQPVQNAVEMGFDTANGGIDALLAKLRGVSYYADLFTYAFGDPAIDESRMQMALAQFERAMISADSRWDRAYAQVFSANAPNRNLDVTLPGFTAEENRGRHLFMGNRGAGGLECAECHEPPTFALVRNSGSNGLDAGESVRFKAPSLKNVGLATAFMHDGRFSTLEQVIDHYDSGIQAGPALDNRLQANNGPRRLNLSAADKAALVAFLRTLTDTNLTTDPRFSNPFR